MRLTVKAALSKRQGCLLPTLREAFLKIGLIMIALAIPITFLFKDKPLKINGLYLVLSPFRCYLYTINKTLE
nr:MAG TPA: hypothetical protein [Bacteriophage sp.]